MLNPFRDSQPPSRHRRTITKTTEDLMKLIHTSSPATPKNLLLSPSQATAHIRNKTTFPESQKPNPVLISEEEAHIRSLINERKQFIKPTQSKFPIKKPQLSIEKQSFNSSTTVNSLEENGIAHIIEILEAIKCSELLKIKSLIIELMERSPEPYFTLVLDADQRVKGIYYIEYSTGCIHKIIASSDLSMIISLKSIQKKLVFDLKKNQFLETQEKFSAVRLRKC